MKHRRLMIGSIVAIAIGSVLWAVTGPAVVLMGIPTPRNSGYAEWRFYEAYAWLSHGGRAPSISEISSTYWLGFAISIIGLSILVAGVTGIIFVAVSEMRAQSLRVEPANIFVRIMSERKIHLNNGILIGAGIVLILLGFYGWFWVNTIYETFSRQFELLGADPSPSSNYAFRHLNLLISYCATSVVAGIVSMLLGVLSEKNRVVSDFMNGRGPHARLVNGLSAGGGVLTISSLQGLFHYLLASDSELSLYFSIVFGAIGIFSIILGIVIHLRARVQTKE